MSQRVFNSYGTIKGPSAYAFFFFSAPARLTSLFTSDANPNNS